MELNGLPGAGRFSYLARRFPAKVPKRDQSGGPRRPVTLATTNANSQKAPGESRLDCHSIVAYVGHIGTMAEMSMENAEAGVPSACYHACHRIQEAWRAAVASASQIGEEAAE